MHLAYYYAFDTYYYYNCLIGAWETSLLARLLLAWTSIMAARGDAYPSIKISRFLMKLVGFWIVDSPSDQIIMDIVLYYTVIAIITAMFTAGLDFFFSINDFHASSY